MKSALLVSFIFGSLVMISIEACTKCKVDSSSIVVEKGAKAVKIKNGKNFLELDCKLASCSILLTKQICMAMEKDVNPDTISVYCNGAGRQKNETYTCENYDNKIKTDPKFKAQMDQLLPGFQCQHQDRGEFYCKEPEKYDCNMYRVAINKNLGKEAGCETIIKYNGGKEIQIKSEINFHCD